jgi:hypothetical protein
MESEVFEPAGSHPIRGAGFWIGTDCRRAPRCASFCEVADSVNTGGSRRVVLCVFPAPARLSEVPLNLLFALSADEACSSAHPGIRRDGGAH